MELGSRAVVSGASGKTVLKEGQVGWSLEQPACGRGLEKDVLLRSSNVNHPFILLFEGDDVGNTSWLIFLSLCKRHQCTQQAGKAKHLH